MRIAVIGLGHFAQTAILPGLRQLSEIELVALVSGTPHKVETLGERYGVARRLGYEQLDELFDGSVDAAYVAVPNDRHAELVVPLARAGLHVICEKPMAPTEKECEAMIAASAHGGGQLMIAYRLHFDPGNLGAVDLIHQGAIGDPRTFTSTFSMQVREGNTRVQDRAGAGPLFDIGVYCINAARYLFREEPDEVMALSLSHPGDPRFAAVDEAVAATLKFPSGRVASFVASFGAADCAHYEVVGTTGHLTLDHAYNTSDPMTLRVVTGRHTRTRVFPKHDQVAAEMKYFASCVRDGVRPEPGGREGLADVRICNAIIASITSGRAVRIEPIEPERRPSPAQAIRVPAHGIVRLVGVEPPAD